ncbi:MAG: DUF885 domain-containing protein [Verrucomicrobiaceae bacterium]|nr:DUF885 domain-containing protein [Verrucomicrobiaceae bacterium]
MKIIAPVKLALTLVILSLPVTVLAQVSTVGPDYKAPGGDQFVSDHANDFRDLLPLYPKDLRTIDNNFPSKIDANRIERMGKFYKDWMKLLSGMDFNAMNRSGKVDYIMFRHRLERDRDQFQEESGRLKKAAEMIPFADEVIALEYRRRSLEEYNIQKLAPELELLAQKIDRIRKKTAATVKAARQAKGGEPSSSEEIFRTAENASRELQKLIQGWFDFYRGFDPLFTWWIAAPSKRLTDSLQAYADTFKKPELAKEGKANQKPLQRKEGFNGENHVSPVGAKRLAQLLADEMIPYSAGELVAIGKRELQWCVKQQQEVARELNFGNDVRKALNHVKSLHVPVGKQPAVIRKLALESIKYLDENDLVTVPQLARDSWRMGMMSPGRQRYNPFFTGGTTISVSYPHNEMTHADKLMSMRGNNPHFSAATVHHELIPGHHLQDFMTSRYNTHRSAYNTVFWTEGWALYWEMLLWDMGFAKTPEDRMGFLFWRMHRCARIIFSLGYHLGEMTPQDCVDLLVGVVGHEPTHAEGEVRRSLAPHTPTLYQCAYMLGGIQFYVLRKEMVTSGKMSNREFHDRILKGNRIPVEMVRAEISGIPLTRDYRTNWRFAEEFRPN